MVLCSSAPDETHEGEGEGTAWQKRKHCHHLLPQQESRGHAKAKHTWLLTFIPWGLQTWIQVWLDTSASVCTCFPKWRLLASLTWILSTWEGNRPGCIETMKSHSDLLRGGERAGQSCVGLAQIFPVGPRRNQDYQMHNTSLAPIVLGKVSGILWWTLELLFSFFPNYLWNDVSNLLKCPLRLLGSKHLPICQEVFQTTFI